MGVYSWKDWEGFQQGRKGCGNPQAGEWDPGTTSERKLHGSRGLVHRSIHTEISKKSGFTRQVLLIVYIYLSRKKEIYMGTHTNLYFDFFFFYHPIHYLHISSRPNVLQIQGDRLIFYPPHLNRKMPYVLIAGSV